MSSEEPEPSECNTNTEDETSVSYFKPVLESRIRTLKSIFFKKRGVSQKGGGSQTLFHTLTNKTFRMTKVSVTPCIIIIISLKYFSCSTIDILIFKRQTFSEV